MYSLEEASVDIIISNSSALPIYEQIYSQVKGSILSGALQPGDLLPSIRSLAKELRISVITTKRAYDELERDGYIVTVAAKGSYVAKKNTELIKETYLKEIEAHLGQVAALAALCSLSEDDVLAIYRFIQQED